MPVSVRPSAGAAKAVIAAKDGDIVALAKGTFFGAVIVDKAIALVGHEPATDSGGYSCRAAAVNTESVTVLALIFGLLFFRRRR